MTKKNGAGPSAKKVKKEGGVIKREAFNMESGEALVANTPSFPIKPGLLRQAIWSRTRLRLQCLTNGKPSEDIIHVLDVVIYTEEGSAKLLQTLKTLGISRIVVADETVIHLRASVPL